MEFGTKINLKRMTCLTIALTIWEQDHMKTRMKEFFCSKSKLNNREKWYNIIKEVLEKVTPDLLPCILHCELLYVIKHVGIRIYEWFRHLRKTKLFGRTPKKVLYQNYFKKIYWTSYGTIDEVKTMKSFWLQNPNVNNSKIYNMACCYCLEEEIDDLWKKIPRNIQLERYTYESLYKTLGLNILAYWDDVRNSSSHSLVGDLVRYMDEELDADLYNLDQSIEENMLKLCATKGYHIAIKYFWDKLDDKKKKKNVVICLKKALDKFMVIYSGKQYRKDRYTEICLFLYQHLTDEMKEELFTSNKSSDGSNKYLCGLKDVFIECWPWQEFLLPELEELLEFFGSTEYIDLYMSVITIMEGEQQFNLPIQNSEIQRKIYQLWYRTPLEYKNLVVLNVTEALFNVWDVSSLRLILNDEDLTEDRPTLLKKGRKKFVELLKENKQEMVEQFFCQILIPTTWNENMRNTVATFYKYLLQNDLNSVNDFLNTHCTSDYEKKIYKGKIDAKFVCYYFIKKEELKLANEFLIWKFESAEKVKNFKSHFKNDEFSKDHIFDIWATSKDNVEISTQRSNNYLNFIFEAKKDIDKFKLENLKKVVTQKGDFVDYKILKYLFIDEGHFEIIEDFLSWCLLSEDEIKFLKKDCVSSLKTSKCRIFIQNDESDTAERFLNWIFKNEYKRDSFIRSFMVSDSGFLALKYFIGVNSAITNKPELKKSELIQKYKKFIDFWIKPLIILDRVEEDLASWKKSSIEFENQETASEVNNTYDSSSSCKSDSEMSDDEDGTYDVYCQKKKLDLFIKLLKSLFIDDTDISSSSEE